MVERVEPSLVLEGVSRRVQTVFGSGVGGSLGEERDTVKMRVPGDRSGRGGGRGEEGTAGLKKGLGWGGRRGVESSLSR